MFSKEIGQLVRFIYIYILNMWSASEHTRMSLCAASPEHSLLVYAENGVCIGKAQARIKASGTTR